MNGCDGIVLSIVSPTPRISEGGSVRRGLIGVCMALVAFSWSAIASADSIELKAGGRLEGEVISTSADEVKIRVGNQVITYPRSEVLRIVMGEPTPPMTQPFTPQGNPFITEMGRGIRKLKALQSTTEAGVNIREYSNRVLDTKVEVDEVVERLTSHAPAQPLLALLKETMDYYVIAMNAWAGSLSKRWISARPDLLERCPELNERYGMLSSGSLWEGSTQPLWTCGRRTLQKLEGALQTFQGGGSISPMAPRTTETAPSLPPPTPEGELKQASMACAGVSGTMVIPYADCQKLIVGQALSGEAATGIMKTLLDLAEWHETECRFNQARELLTLAERYWQSHGKAWNASQVIGPVSLTERGNRLNAYLGTDKETLGKLPDTKLHSMEYL